MHKGIQNMLCEQILCPEFMDNNTLIRIFVLENAENRTLSSVLRITSATNPRFTASVNLNLLYEKSFGTKLIR